MILQTAVKWMFQTCNGMSHKMLINTSPIIGELNIISFIKHALSSKEIRPHTTDDQKQSLAVGRSSIKELLVVLPYIFVLGKGTFNTFSLMIYNIDLLFWLIILTNIPLALRYPKYFKVFFPPTNSSVRMLGCLVV